MMNVGIISLAGLTGDSVGSREYRDYALIILAPSRALNSWRVRRPGGRASSNMTSIINAGVWGRTRASCGATTYVWRR
jgi:hypothetical protein